MSSTYQAWTICETEGCGFIGDSWWQEKDGIYSYFCPECKQTHTTTIDEDTIEYNKHDAVEHRTQNRVRIPSNDQLTFD